MRPLAPEEAQRLALAYEAEAARARQWAAIRRNEAENEEKRADLLIARAAEFRRPLLERRR